MVSSYGVVRCSFDNEMTGRVANRRKPADKTAGPVSKSTASCTKAKAPPVVDKAATHPPRKRKLVGSDDVHESDAAVSSTKRGRVDGDREQRVAKKPKTDSKHLQVSTKASGVLNQASTAVCTVLIFGNGDNGELGLGPNKTESLRPRKNPFLNPGDSSKLHVVKSPVASRHLAADTVFVQVAAGDSCSFALTETGLVYGWGTFRDSKGDERFGYEADGRMITKQDKPSLIRGVQDITQLACGVGHVLALDTSGNIWGWGNNEQNQLGRRLFGRDQDSLILHQIRVCRNNAKYIASGEYHSFAIDKKDNVWGWGLNSFGEAGDPGTAGTNSAVLPECFVWGRMDGGQLGFTFTPEQLQDAAQLGLNSEEDVEVAQRVKGRDADEAMLTWSGAGGQFSVISAPATLG
ncbi:regulator of chromosome condensation [Verticillium dahliae VdLs.17]|uniref:Regulator of chromosome condensation n=1 Tax=Verticillium dahliae (strain VdLs.17 / ATCC MYA-4575 / FGSC 10137) TaxID=498257 RepID=G2X0G6_VERDV|nr:regulator of chromosome condensation [Verticillium dahliae VdLs.17]EGY22307.1 regulator of chromosome condensation [Verticillium dahliae VdLs.17]